MEKKAPSRGPPSQASEEFTVALLSCTATKEKEAAVPDLPLQMTAPLEIWQNIAVCHPLAARGLHGANRTFRVFVPRTLVTEADFQRVWFQQGSLYGCLLWVVQNEHLRYFQKICDHVNPQGRGWVEGCAELGIPQSLDSTVQEALTWTSFEILACAFERGLPIDVGMAVDIWVKENRWDVILSAVQNGLISSDGVLQHPAKGTVSNFVGNTVTAAATANRFKCRRFAMSIAIKCVEEAQAKSSDWVLGEGLFPAIRVGCDSLVPLYFPLISDHLEERVLRAALKQADACGRKHLSSAVRLEWRRRNQTKVDRGLLTEEEVDRIICQK